MYLFIELMHIYAPKGGHYINTTDIQFIEVELILAQTFKFYVWQKINTI
jgi:hypothetical protein